MEEVLEKLFARGIYDLEIRRECNITKPVQGWTIDCKHHFRRQSMEKSPPGTANFHFKYYTTDLRVRGDNVLDALANLNNILDNMDSYTKESEGLKIG